MPYDDEERKTLLDSLIRQHGDELKRIAFLYVNDLAESEDIIQEVFIKAYQKLDDFRQEASYRTWLIRMTINQCKDHRKKWSVRNIFYRDELPERKGSDQTEHVYIEQEIADELAGQLAALSPKFKEVLILFYYEELTMREISEVLQLNENTVKSRLLRGKKALKEKLERSDWNG